MPSAQKKFILVLAVLLALQACVNFVKYSSEKGRFGGDFIMFWQAEQNIAHGDEATFYDPEKLHAYIQAYHTPGSTLPLPPLFYPPHTLLLLWPIGHLTYNQSAALWTLTSLLLFYAMLFLVLREHVRAHHAASTYAIITALLLPFVSASVFAGQTGNLMGALFLAIVVCWRRHPAIAGICLGIMTIKPQLCLLTGVAILVSGEWCILAYAALTTLFLALTTLVWLGPAIWSHYPFMAQAYSDLVFQGSPQFNNLAIGPYISLHGAGLPVTASLIMQVVISLGIVAVIIKAFRRDDKRNTRFALLACGTLLVTPNTMSYDSPLLAIAVLVFLLPALSHGFKNSVHLLALVFLLIMPYAQLVMMPLHIPFGMLSLLLFLMVLWQQYKNDTLTQAGTGIEPSSAPSSS